MMPKVERRKLTKAELCPALLHDRDEERVVCVRVPDHPPGAFGFTCWSCLEAIVGRHRCQVERYAALLEIDQKGDSAWAKQ